MLELDIGTHIIELWVTDQFGLTSIDTVVVTVIPKSSGLVAHWKFDETEGLIAEDSSGNNHDANVVNASVPDCWRWGRVGRAISLNAGNSEYIDLNPDGNNVEYFPGGAHGRTIMGWFEAGDNRQPTFFDYGTDGPNYPGGHFAITASSDRLAVTIGSHIFGTESFCPIKGWHHIAVVFPDGAERSNQVKIYLDGDKQHLYTLDDSGEPFPVSTNAWEENSIGYIGRDRNGHYFNGGIDDVRVYARGLRNSEIPVIPAKKTRYHIVDLGPLGPVENPQTNEVRAINNQQCIVGRTIIFLKPDTTYYWRVDEKTDECLTKGNIWKFTTDPNLN